MRQALKWQDSEPPVLVLAGAAQALDYLLRQPAHDGSAEPMVIVLDLWTSEDAWRDILRQLREHPETRDVPVVVLGPSHDDWAVLRSHQHGADAFLAKPEGRERVAASVREAASYWISIQRDADGAGDVAEPTPSSQQPGHRRAG